MKQIFVIAWTAFGFHMAFAQTIAPLIYNDHGLGIRASKDGYNTSVGTDWKTAKNKSLNTYTTGYSYIAASGYKIDVSTQVNIDWKNDSGGLLGVTHVTKQNGVVSSKYTTVSDGTTYYQVCEENSYNQLLAKEAKKSIPPKIDCDIVTPDLCSAYQQQFAKNGGMSAEELKKCEGFYDLIISRKRDARTLDYKARTDAQKLGVSLPENQSFNTPVKIEFLRDASMCGSLAELRGESRDKFETPIQRAEREGAAAKARSSAGLTSGGSGASPGAIGKELKGGANGGIVSGQTGTGQK